MLVDNALPSPVAGASTTTPVDDEDSYMDDWDMYDDDDEGPVASGSGTKRNHVVFTDSIEAGEFIKSDTSILIAF